MIPADLGAGLECKRSLPGPSFPWQSWKTAKAQLQKGKVLFQEMENTGEKRMYRVYPCDNPLGMLGQASPGVLSSSC